MDRGEFFSKALTLLVGKGADLVAENPVMKGLEKLAEPLPPSKVRQRPPGALETEEAFQKRCTGCDRCMVACPVNVIMIEDWESRLPLIFPEESPCVHCEGYPCVQACPSGALSGPLARQLREF